MKSWLKNKWKTDEKHDKLMKNQWKLTKNW
jgi:hypothetical protein